MTTTKQLITLHLIIPANQCGSLIGKGGAKIKEIRDVSSNSTNIVDSIKFKFFIIQLTLFIPYIIHFLIHTTNDIHSARFVGGLGV